MTDIGREQISRSEANVIWVGKSNIDPYRDQCICEFTIRDYGSIYEAVAAVLTESLNVRLLILNALSVASEPESIVRTLINYGIFSDIVIYNPARHFSKLTISSALFDHSHVRVVETKEELLELLHEKLSVFSSVSVSSVSDELTRTSDKPSSNEVDVGWPTLPPSQEIPDVEISSMREEKNRAHGIDDEKEDGSISAKDEIMDAKGTGGGDSTLADDFKLAELTQAELDALLGGDFEAEGNKK
jgi:hypothetical protein